MLDYKSSGVDIEEGYRSVEKIKAHAARTMNSLVLSSIGAFAGMMEIPKGYTEPVLITGTDGVGTKLKVAFEMNRYDTFGIDCVAMCVNDILCHGAKPLFFLDYIACGKLDASVSSDIVAGVAEGCVQGGMALIGGETAEMPGFYAPGEYDIAGFAVGVQEKSRIIDGKKIKEGDLLIGIRSSGFHSNGYSLLRKIFTDLKMEFDGETIGDYLLRPTRIYREIVEKAMEKFEIHAMAHITGGGPIENIPRIFADKSFDAVMNRNSYTLPKVYSLLKDMGHDPDTLYNTFNMGIGYVFCISSAIKEDFLSFLISEGEDPIPLGFVRKGEGKLCIE